MLDLDRRLDLVERLFDQPDSNFAGGAQKEAQSFAILLADGAPERQGELKLPDRLPALTLVRADPSHEVVSGRLSPLIAKPLPERQTGFEFLERISVGVGGVRVDLEQRRFGQECFGADPETVSGSLRPKLKELDLVTPRQ